MTDFDRLTWRTPARSQDNAACVDVANGENVVFMRDTKHAGAGPVLMSSRDQWEKFVHETSEDRPSANGAVVVSRERMVVSYPGRGEVVTWWHVRACNGSAELHFTTAEWTAFRLGLQDGEYDDIMALVA